MYELYPALDKAGVMQKRPVIKCGEQGGGGWLRIN